MGATLNVNKVTSTESPHPRTLNLADLEGIKLTITMKIADRQIDVVVDTGAERSILSKKWASQMGMDCDNKPAVRLKGAFNAPPPH